MSKLAKLAETKRVVLGQLSRHFPFCLCHPVDTAKITFLQMSMRVNYQYISNHMINSMVKCYHSFAATLAEDFRIFWTLV